MSDHNIQVFFNLLHDPAVRHNTAGDPILTWVQDYPHHGNGWCLDYHDGDAAFIGGDLTDVDAAVRQANKWLDQVEAEPS